VLSELTSLAALASCRTDLTLQVGDADCHWSFNWATNVITVNPTDLALRPPDYCRGLILHESAHAALTRVAEIIPRALYQADLHPLLNVIEDCRIENWLQLRLPGCRPWMRLYNDRILGNPSETIREHISSNPAGGFLSGLLDQWWHETPQLELHPETQRALSEVLPHFQDAIAAFPGPRAPHAAPVRKSYHAHPVSLCFRSQDYHWEPSPEECIIRMLQHRMWNITWQHIVPVYRRLLEHPDSKPTHRNIVHPADALGTYPSSATCSGDHIMIVTRIPGHDSELRPIPGKAIETAQDGDVQPYRNVVVTHASLIESCADTLLRVLTADSRAKRSRFHRSGHALDLRVAMQFEADPRLHEKLWQRSTLPKHPDPAFAVLVDASGSMQGERAEATFTALVVLREVCLRLGIPLTIIGFTVDAQLLQSWDDLPTRAIQSKLTGLLNPNGATDISPALALASQLLDQSPRLHRHLWILSDGDTRDPDAARHKIRALRASGTMIHGLGLGSDSRHIAELIPGALTNLTPEQLPAALARMLLVQASHT